MSWSKGYVEWIENDTAFLSIAFSWKIRQAYSRAIWLKSEGYKVRAGGPGLSSTALKRWMEEVAVLGGDVDALIHHNKDATRASRGCPVGCYFCIVPIAEGKGFTYLPDFTPRPILCDNNLSALPVEYQEFIIEKYIKFDVPLIDATNGFEPASFDNGTYQRWKRINLGDWRFGYDETKEEKEVYRAIQVLKDVPNTKKRIYVMIGNEPFQACYRRIRNVIDWGCEPYVQRFIALNAMERKPVVRYDWTKKKLNDLARWSNRWIWRTVPFEDYITTRSRKKSDQEELI
jgi:hypothetical protein